MMSGLAANGQTQEESNWKNEFQIPRHPINDAARVERQHEST